MKNILEERAPVMRLSNLLVGLLLITGCATSPQPAPGGPGTREINRNAVLHEGPEMAATVAYLQGDSTVAEEWLVLAVEFTGVRGSSPFVVKRGDISLYTPDGRRLPISSQDEFRRNFNRLRITIDRTFAFLPLLHLYQPNRIPCGRWFVAAPPEIDRRSVARPLETIGFDDIAVNSTTMCSGPLVFNVPGGIQPGRWRLVFELTESRADIPFVLEMRN